MSSSALPISDFSYFLPIAQTIIFAIFFVLFFNAIIIIVKRRLIAKAKNRRQTSNIQLFAKVLRYGVVVTVVIFGLIFYSGSWAGFGVAAGLMSAAIGFALQKPIAGLAAWLVIIVQRPFSIGDRIIFGDVKGDVMDIGLTHIKLREVGLEADGEEISGKITVIPGSFLFDHAIVNYTQDNDYILGKVVVSITYESDMERAKEIVLQSGKKWADEFLQPTLKEPYIRLVFAPSSIDISVKFYATHDRMQEVKSKITDEIYKNIKKEKEVNIAYPHTEVILQKYPED